MNADADTDGAAVVLICDGSTWNAMASGAASGAGANMMAGYYNDSGNELIGYISASYATAVGQPALAIGSYNGITLINGKPIEGIVVSIDTGVTQGTFIITEDPVSSANTTIIIDGSSYDVTFAQSNSGYTNYTVSPTISFVYGETYNIGGGSGGGVTSAAGSSGQIQFNGGGGAFGASNNLFWDTTNNRLGVNTDAPAVALGVVGDIHYTGTIVDVSDIRMKYDIRPVENSLAKITGLNGFSFKMKSDQSNNIEYGVSAQDVQRYFPELVHQVDDSGTLGVSYNGLIAPMIEAIKTQQTQIENLQFEIESLKTEMNDRPTKR